MTEQSLWRFSRAFHRALNERQTDDLESILDENVDWAIYGPIDMFAFLGPRHGKRAVIDVVREISGIVSLHRFDRESLMIGENSTASLMRYSLTSTTTGTPISVRIAIFAKFNAGRLINLRAIIDTFDLVEQALGRQIHLPKIA
ncbi:MAG: nuclear transport factor 2 family protein [Afipia sp.]|nr:nuclear transport factor 2 family protein [Afipia sp.]